MSRAVRAARDALSNRSAGEADELDLATETKPCKCKAESKPRLVYRPGKGYFWAIDTSRPASPLTSVIRIMNLKPFFTFYGGKWRAAPHYPPPEFATVVEPFAGAAGYSVRHHERRVTLVERDPLIAATWRYLIRSSPQEILALPDIAVGQTTDDLPICPEARLLVGWWVNGGSATPKKSMSLWARSRKEHGGQGWTTGGALPDDVRLPGD